MLGVSHCGWLLLETGGNGMCSEFRELEVFRVMTCFFTYEEKGMEQKPLKPSHHLFFSSFKQLRAG